MIAFSCAHCGMKLKVKPEFAGRSSCCPTCKQPLTVPVAEATQAFVPQERIDGAPSSIHQAGLDAGVTLDQAAPHAGQKPLLELLARRSGKGERYLIAGEIARGGMGAVLRAVDCDIRREVAVKYLLDQADPAKKLRFVEEAQITGQLEHPNIPPVHELGIDARKRLFFSMKMVQGRSLAQVLDELRHPASGVASAPRTEKEWPLSRLLSVFVNVCHAVAFAHARGVVHRDLKPANIMVGDFGEVYVMDWGLAKVLASGVASAPRGASGVASAPRGASGGRPPPGEAPAPDSAASTGGLRPPLAASVSTSRAGEADLTQEGAVLGTPVYMPPEQAAGRIDAIDQRSDVYSLGAILYELLTLQAPIDREGGYLAVLMRAMQGDIRPPEQRVRRAGGVSPRSIPRELSAVAMKALAQRPQDRYPSVEALRQDIERFQEGRSVSARDDSFREAVWKLVKRNRQASIVTGMASLVLLGVVAIAFSSINAARLRAERANADLRAAEDAKRQQALGSVPTYVRAARLAANEREFGDALVQVNTALEYQPDHAGALLLKGKVLTVRQEFPKAVAVLKEYVRLQPEDAFAGKLLALCRKADARDSRTIAPIIDLFLENQEVPLARGMGDVRDQLLASYRQRINQAWPGLGERLKLDAGGKLDLYLDNCTEQVGDLSPLRGMPLTTLSMHGCAKVQDLTPLAGMPLTVLSLAGCNMRDLAPLRGMSLTSLSLYSCLGVTDLAPLRGMPLRSLNLAWCRDVRDLSPLQGMPLTSLTLLRCTQVHDLSPLKGMPLTTLNLGEGHAVRDLTPLQGMPLATLNLTGCRLVRDLSPLKGMPLTSLHLWGCNQLTDLTPLQGLDLNFIQLSPADIRKGMNVLRAMKSLKSINGLVPDEFWKKYDAGEFNK